MRVIKLLQTAVLALTLSAPALATAGEGVPLPAVPAAKGEQCVEDTAVMRRNHMEYLKHQRDATMHEGIRTTKYSLNQCLECHVPTKEEAQASAGKDEGQHFCASCHKYAGVTIDCFQCHATRPEGNALFHPLVTPGMQKMSDVHQAKSGELLNRLAGDKTETGVSQ